MSNDPRLLLIDMTDMSSSAATSMLKATYFSGWAPGRLLQLQAFDPRSVGLSANGGDCARAKLPDNGALQILRAFNPQIILYRPLPDHADLHALAMEIISLADAPLALWLMDDWPARLETSDRGLAARMNEDLSFLFQRSSLNFAISEGMALAFRERYRVDFNIARNGVDPLQWPAEQRTPSKSLTLRYAGSLAPDTTRDAVFDVAECVSKLADDGTPIRFEARTQKTWLKANRARFDALKHASISTAKFTDAEYRAWLVRADIALIAYNFDAYTREYLRFSFANKTPELLASGAAVLAYGPSELETIRYLEANDVALRVTRNHRPSLEAAIARLVSDSDLRRQLAQSGRRHVFSEMNIVDERQRILDKLRDVALDGDVARRGLSSEEIVRRFEAPRPAPHRRLLERLAQFAPWND